MGQSDTGPLANPPPLNSPGAGIAKGAAPVPQGLPSQPSSADGKGVHLDKIKLYMPNFLPRSGQSMKFSFAPHNEMAIQAFGVQAFPMGHTGPKLPNRGPMSAHPPMPMNHAHGLNASSPHIPVSVPSNAPRTTPSNDSDVEMIGATTRPPAPHPSHARASDIQAASANDNVISIDDNNKPFSSTAICSGPFHGRSSSLPSVAYNGPLNTMRSPAIANGMHASVAASPVSAGNAAIDANTADKGKGRALDSQIQHPEVMVIDQ